MFFAIMRNDNNLDGLENIISKHTLKSRRNIIFNRKSQICTKLKLKNTVRGNDPDFQYHQGLSH